MEPLRDYLVSRGLDVWTDENLEPGTSVWFREVDQAIRESRIMLVLMSPHLLEPNPDNPEYGSFVLNEVQQALQLRKKFYTILLDGDEVSAVPLQLKAIQWVDVRGRYVRSVDEVYSRLAQQMANDLGVELKDPPTHQVQVTVEGDVSGTLSVAGGNIFGGLGAPPALAWPEEIGQAFDGLPDPPREGLRDASPISRRYALMLVQRDLLPDAKLREPLSQVLSYMAQHDTDSETKGLAQTVLQALQAARAEAAERARLKQQVDGLLAEARRALKAGDFDAAEAALQQANELAPGDQRISNLRQRVQAARAEAAEQARRRDPILDILPPPFEWCEIPGVSPFRLMTDQGDKGTYDIDPFFMAKYLITFEQFQVFVDDPQGFTNPQWWQGLAAHVSHRAEPGNQRFTHAKNLPRDSVSWYDAVAFCRWLTSRVGYEVRLPTEWEWQWAAQGPDGRAYPWGPEYIQGYANINEETSGVKGGVYLVKTTPVGSYPQGASPYGVLDMSGNVWEWCLNEYDRPENTDLAGDADRVARGGSWIINQDFARAAFRFWFDPDLRRSNIGFRVVVRPPSLSNH